MSAIFEAIELGKENRRLRKDLKACRGELRVLKRCCQEALSGSWDLSDDGFKAMVDGIDNVLQGKGWRKQ